MDMRDARNYPSSFSKLQKQQWDKQLDNGTGRGVNPPDEEPCGRRITYKINRAWTYLSGYADDIVIFARGQFERTLFRNESGSLS